MLREVGDRAGEATILANIGGIHDAQGDFQQALTYFNQALPLLREVGDRAGEANTLGNFGAVYGALGDHQQALTYFNQALPLLREVGDRAVEANTLNNIGAVYDAQGDFQQALTYFNQALPLLREVGDRAVEANTLGNIGRVHHALREHQQALIYHNQALSLSRQVGARVGEAITLNNIGAVYHALGKRERALGYYNQALPLLRQVGDRAEEATTLNNIGTLYKEQHNLTEALSYIDSAITLIEDLRTSIGSYGLRSSYLATQYDVYQLKIDTLMDLHRQHPEQGYDIAAFETNERGRARSFIESLNEAQVDIWQGVDPQLRDQAQQLQQQLQQLEEQRVRLVQGQFTADNLDNLDRQSQTLLNQLDQLIVQIRATNPAYADLLKPQPLTLQQIQQQVLDPDTVLLQYSLGEERSYLWVVSQTDFTTYELPGRADIEEAAKEFYSTLDTSKNTLSDIRRKGVELAQLILPLDFEPLQGKRLLIVADGILHQIPFAALPLANTQTYTPLVTTHEILHQPSASSVAVLRQRFGDRAPAPKTLAVLADPVFRADDPRLSANTSGASRATTESATVSVELQSTLRYLDLGDIKRLANTRREADAILNLVPDSERTSVFDFDANYDWVTQPELSHLDQYRMVLFATHGFVNEIPALSGLVLSLFDRQGQPRNGFLRLSDIYNLDLAADLVVLSACQTGLGNEVKGEGIISLTRGFMYAGAERVVVSLWSVDDEKTAELMTSFYQAMLSEGKTPAAALRETQVSMWQRYPQDPRLWAAFTIQGEWRE